MRLGLIYSSIISSYMPAITPLWNMITGFLGASLAAYSMVSAIVNLIFVGIGASLGASSYNKSKGTEKRNVKISAKRNVPTANFVVQSRYGVAKPSVNLPSYVSSPSISVSSLSGLDRLILERFRAGASLEQIASEAGVDIIEVQNRFIGLMDKGLVDLQLNQLELRILEGARSGINVREIAEQTGVSEETINWEINKLRAMTLLDNIDFLHAKWDRIADIQVVDNSGNMGSVKFILKNGEMLKVSEVPYPDQLVEYLRKRFLNQGTGTLNQASLYQSVQQVVSQPYVPSYNQPQSVSTSQPIQPVTIQGDILWPYKRRKGRINMYRRIGYALLIIGLIPLPIGIALYGLILGILTFIIFGAIFFVVGIILAVIYRIPKDALPISLPLSYYSRGAVSREEAKNNYFMKSDGVYRGKKLVFKWSDVADIQLLTIDETKNEGLVRFVLRNGKTVDIPRVMYPMNLVEYVKKTYLGQGSQ